MCSAAPPRERASPVPNPVPDPSRIGGARGDNATRAGGLVCDAHDATEHAKPNAPSRSPGTHSCIQWRSDEACDDRCLADAAAHPVPDSRLSGPPIGVRAQLLLLVVESEVDCSRAERRRPRGAPPSRLCRLWHFPYVSGNFARSRQSTCG